MASSLACLRSAASTFHGLDIAQPILCLISARLHSSSFSSERSDGLHVKATSVDFGGETVVRLKSTYMDIIVLLLIQEFNYKNHYQVPKIEKVVVKCGTGGGTQTANGLKTAMAELTLITGQSPVKKKATN
ncbi:hypothetical protein ACS0TY_019810 [Phlomoides rotata]